MNEPAEIKRSLEDLMESIRGKVQTRQSVEESAKDTVAEIRKAIPVPTKAEPPQEQAWLPFAPMPSDMCRVSPFFPMNPRQLEKREYIDGLVISKNAWGEITFYGPKLSTFDEDVLLALLAVLDATRDPAQVEVDGKKTLVYNGPMLPLLRLMGVNSSGLNYKRVTATLTRLTFSGLKLKTTKGHWMLTTILTGAVGQEGRTTVSIAVNPYFYEMYVAGNISLIDVMTRARLKRPTAKALYRFATSHRGAWRGHFLTLAAALNLDLEQPHFKIRAILKIAMGELKKHELIGKKSRFDGQDVVDLQKVTTGGKKAKSIDATS